MKPFDANREDRVPEENAAQQKNLAELLQQTLPQQTALPAEEQEQIVARVRTRLLFQNSALLTDENSTGRRVSTVNESALSAVSLLTKREQRGRSIIRAFNALAAVFIVGALIGASLLLFVQHEPAPGGPTMPPIPSGEGATSSADGLSMSLRITPGPYFLSEMLAADITLTNHSQKPVFVGLPFVPSACGYWSGVALTGGSEPKYTLPIATDHKCPNILGNAKTLLPDQTLTVHKYVLLTSSEKQTLTAQASFLSGAHTDKSPFPTYISHPLEKHWPKVEITVSPKIPSDRKLSFSVDGSRVIVQGPAGVADQLVYLYRVSCDVVFNTPGTEVSGNYNWEERTTNVVNAPACSGKNIHWDFAFGAPGYAIVTGSHPFPE